MKTEQEIQEQVDNIHDMEVAIKAKENPLKLAETRLENRNTHIFFRPFFVRTKSLIVLCLAKQQFNPLLTDGSIVLNYLLFSE